MKSYLYSLLLVTSGLTAGCSVAPSSGYSAAPVAAAVTTETAAVVEPLHEQDFTSATAVPDVVVNVSPATKILAAPDPPPDRDAGIAVEPTVAATMIAAPTVTRRQSESLTRAYVVKDGETLWTIAARPELYGDALLWSLLYQANRDQIKDPRQIYPEQVLSVPRDLSEEELQEAREWARKSEVFPVEN